MGEDTAGVMILKMNEDICGDSAKFREAPQYHPRKGVIQATMLLGCSFRRLSCQQWTPIPGVSCCSSEERDAVEVFDRLADLKKPSFGAVQRHPPRRVCRPTIPLYRHRRTASYRLLLHGLVAQWQSV